MLATLLIFSLLTYGLAYLIADATIFGCPTVAYLADPTDEQYIKDNAGLLPIRQAFLQVRFFRELLRCYFCMGAWCGAVVHLTLLLLYHLDKTVPLLSSYFLLSRSVWSTAISIALAAVLGCAVCGVTNLLVRVLENKASTEQPPARVEPEIVGVATVCPCVVDQGQEDADGNT